MEDDYDEEPLNHGTDPAEVLQEAEQQWLYTEEELLHTPSIRDGMSPEEERQLRSKGTNFITQVGIMLKLPQMTLSTASIFFNRFLMRRSLVKKEGYKPLHHYQIAATALFLATKVEEHTRKLKDLVIACCRVAQKNPNLLVDEQTKDFWLWRDTIILNEDVLLEVLCFDLAIESPYKLLYDALRFFGLHHNKKLRDAAWAFINDSHLTQLCLLYTSRTIAATALYFAARSTEVEVPDDEEGTPWWEVLRVKLRDIQVAMNYMADFYEAAPGNQASQAGSQYAEMRTPIGELARDVDDRLDITRPPIDGLEENGNVERRPERKRAREDYDEGGEEATNGHQKDPSQTLSVESEAKRRRSENRDMRSEGSEEGEVEEE